MKTNKISTKIKILGALLVVVTFTVIAVTLMLNQKNSADALIVNIAGKERMLSQKISKNIFYTKAVNRAEFQELDDAVNEFIWGLNTLKNGDETLKIKAAPTQEIVDQIETIEKLWEPFLDNVSKFKIALQIDDSNSLKEAIDYIANHNERLLLEVDQLVTMYTNHINEKTDFMKKFQYAAFIVLFLLVFYSITKLREIEKHAQEFISKSKELMSNDITAPIEPLNIESEEEIAEVANSLNHFVNKVNSVMIHSESAIKQSEEASRKLEELTEDFSTIIGELQGCNTIASHIDKSEDMMIQSSEDLIKSTQKLQNLKKELDSLLHNCKQS